jgi:hypothetical protein
MPEEKSPFVEGEPKVEEVEAEIVEESQLAIRDNQREVDLQVATAKRYPRSITAFREKVLELATIDQETAEECWYALPRAGKVIEGPGIRFAEIVGVSYKNLRSAARHISTGDDFVTCEGVCWDLENNVAVRTTVNRRITNSRGERFNEDMIGTTIGAACSIALRNATFRVVPKAIYHKVLAEIKQIAMGKGRTITETRKAIIDHFARLGVKTEQLLSLIGKKGVEDITLEDATTLRGLATAIKEGTTTVQEAFQSNREAPKVGSVPKTVIKPGKAEHTAPGAVQPKPEKKHISDRIASSREAYKLAVGMAMDRSVSEDQIAEISWMEGITEGVDKCEDPDAIDRAVKKIQAI